MGSEILANRKKRRRIFHVLIITGILLIFSMIHIFHSNKIDEFNYLKQERFDPGYIVEPSEPISLSDSDVIWVDGTCYQHPDKLFDIEEIWIYGTDERNPDTDGDGMEDGWEAYYGVVDNKTGLLTIDPLRFDAFKDPDEDGWDADFNNEVDASEQLTNLEEYCGGSYSWGPFKDLNLDPESHYDNYELYKKRGDLKSAKIEYDILMNELTYIREHGGFYLIDYPYSEVILDNFDEYNRTRSIEYRSFNPHKDKPITTNPSELDTDNDGMSDGFEIYYESKCEYVQRKYLPCYNFTLNPLEPNDADKNIDIRKTNDCMMGKTELEYELKPDKLTNLQEFQFGTDPTLFDSDDDSYYELATNSIHWLSDDFELKDRIFLEFDGQIFNISNVDWDESGIINLNTNPRSPDTDGDTMSDGWEEYYGLNPCNASDRFLDPDGDGLANYLEFAYPNTNEPWFQTLVNDKDTDDDGIPDGWEAFHASVIRAEFNVLYESDISDGSADGIAHLFTCNPMIPDADLDLDGFWYGYLDDGYHKDEYHQHPDNLTNLHEYLKFINPNSPDSDGDGLLDGEEEGYYYCSKHQKPVTWWLCDNEDCELYGEKINDRFCVKCESISNTPFECDIKNVDYLGGFYGELINGRWLSDPKIVERYFTDAGEKNTDYDFQFGVRINTSRLLDDWEEVHGMKREGVDGIDNDGDGLIDKADSDEVFTFEPMNASFWDTDHDGLGDVDELFGIDTGSEFDVNDPLSGYGIVFTDPCSEDTDNDDLNDYLEISRLSNYKPYITDPQNRDSDGDGLSDELEWSVDFYPIEDFDIDNNYDANGDGVGDEFDNGLMINGFKIENDIDRTNPRNSDSDLDGLPDGWEYKYGATRLKRYLLWHDNMFGSNWARHPWLMIWPPSYPNTDFWVINPVGQNDRHLDPDGDGLDNWDEYLLGTDPLNIDSDYDGLPDYWELEQRTFKIKNQKYNLDPFNCDSISNDKFDDEDSDGNFDPVEELWDGRDNDGDGEIVPGAADGIDNDDDGLIDESDEVSYINWIDDDGDGQVDEGIDEEWDLNDANEDYDHDGVWYTISWVDDDSDGFFDEDAMDDDLDGFINEDPYDGLDNDKDGRVDEDTGGYRDDNDGDGLVDEDPKRYYHPFTNLMEYRYGYDIDLDGINENTTFPNECDSDSDGIWDGWEIWYTDYLMDSSNPQNFQDNDSLPSGWEELFNGSLVLFPTDYVPRGLLDPETAVKYIGKFDPNKKDSDGDGVPDDEENYDDDTWIDLHKPRPEEIVEEKCTNYVEYCGHSDPTYEASTPKLEGRTQYCLENCSSENQLHYFSAEKSINSLNYSLIDFECVELIVIEIRKIEYGFWRGLRLKA